MLTYIEGIVEELAPDHAVIGVSGLGYFINISLSLNSLSLAFFS